MRDFKYDCKDRLKHDVVAGLNYSMIVNSCCLLEGVFESGLSAIWNHKKKNAGSTASLLKESSIRRGRGLKTYDELFGLITGKRFSVMQNFIAYHEGVKTHFLIRHLLAHGRSTIWSHQGSEGSLELRPNDENLDFESSYKNVEVYLIKKKLIPHSVTGGIWPNPYLSNEIGDHFAVLAFDAICSIISSLEAEDSEIFIKATAPASQFEGAAKYLRKSRVSPL
jgi:hypothetical protein